MHSQPLPAHPFTASRGRENGAPTRTSAGQGSSRQGYCKSRRRGSQGREIRAASTRSKTSGLNPVRSQVRLSGISVDRPDRYAASSAKHGELLRAETNRFAQVSTFNTRAPDRSPTEICSAQVRATQVGSNPASEVIADPRNCSSSRRSKSSLKVPLSASPVGSAIAALAPPSRQIKHRKRPTQLHGGISARIHYQHSKRLQSQTGWSPLSSIAVMPAIRR